MHNTSCILCSVDTLGEPWADQLNRGLSCTTNVSTGGANRAYGAVLSSLEVMPGWWRPTEHTYKDTKADGLRECPYGKAACSGGTRYGENGNSYCTTGHRGPLCSICERDYTYDSGKNACVHCSGASFGITFSPAMAIFLALLGVALLVILRTLYLKAKRSNKCTNMSIYR